MVGRKLGVVCIGKGGTGGDCERSIFVHRLLVR